MANEIKSISYLRKVVDTNGDVTFKRAIINAKSGHFSARVSGKNKVIAPYKNLSAMQFVELEYVRNGDPVITMTDGDKMRVYQGGKPPYMMAVAASWIDNHDKLYHKPKKKFKLKNKVTSSFSFPFFH